MKRGWSVNDVMPGSDGPENLKILKKVNLELTVGQAGDNFVSAIVA